MHATTPAQAPAAIEIVALTKRYASGKPAVDAINLRIASGSYAVCWAPRAAARAPPCA